MIISRTLPGGAWPLAVYHLFQTFHGVVLSLHLRFHGVPKDFDAWAPCAAFGIAIGSQNGSPSQPRFLVKVKSLSRYVCCRLLAALSERKESSLLHGLLDVLPVRRSRPVWTLRPHWCLACRFSRHDAVNEYKQVMIAPWLPCESHKFTVVCRFVFCLFLSSLSFLLLLCPSSLLPSDIGDGNNDTAVACLFPKGTKKFDPQCGASPLAGRAGQPCYTCLPKLAWSMPMSKYIGRPSATGVLT